MTQPTIVEQLVAWAAERGYEPECLNYGPDPDQVADLTVPRGAERRHPVAVLVHGGFWRTPYERHLMNALATFLGQREWATWNVEYRRGPGSGADGRAIADVRAAISMLRLIPEPLDLKRVFVIGHSAGGHLALSVAAPVGARRVISLAGVADLHTAAQERIGNGAAIEFMDGTPEQRPAEYAEADPLLQIPTGVDTLLVHGDEDESVPLAQSHAYLDAARAAGDGARCELLELPGVSHIPLIDPRSAAFATWVEKLEG